MNEIRIPGSATKREQWSQTWQSVKWWIVASLLVALTANFAAYERGKPDSAIVDVPAPKYAAEPRATQAPANSEPAAEEQPGAKIAKGASASPKPKAAEEETVVTACHCDKAELELPDICPNESCRVCKATCGIIGN